jgi:hypothetical protein
MVHVHEAVVPLERGTVFRCKAGHLEGGRNPVTGQILEVFDAVWVGMRVYKAREEDTSLSVNVKSGMG